MKNLLYILLLSIVLPQVSSHYLNGFGEKQYLGNSSMSALANSLFFNGTDSALSSNTTSTLWKSRLTRIQTISLFQNVSSNDFSKQSGQQLQSISFSFPFRKTSTIRFGLQPYTRMNTNLLDPYYQAIPGYIISDFDPENTEINDPIFYKSEYIIGGGISGFSMGYSTSLKENLSMGLKWDIQFGNLDFNQHISYYDVHYDLDVTTYEDSTVIVSDTIFVNESVSLQKLNFEGQSVTLDAQYSKDSNTLAWLMKIATPSTIVNNLEVNGVPIPVESITTEGFSVDYIALGYQHKINTKLGITAEFHNQFAIKNPEDIVLFSYQSPNYYSIHTGLFKIYENPRIGFWNSITFRTGFVFKQVQLDESLNDICFTMGLGVDFIKSQNSIDLSLVLGDRESAIPGYSNEKYAKITVGITTGDRWFLNRRSKH